MREKNVQISLSNTRSASKKKVCRKKLISSEIFLRLISWSTSKRSAEFLRIWKENSDFSETLKNFEEIEYKQNFVEIWIKKTLFAY